LSPIHVGIHYMYVTTLNKPLEGHGSARHHELDTLKLVE
jgi:hypothetical protein